MRNRKPVRCGKWNYSNIGAYFVTMVIKNRVPRFGEIENGAMVLNKLGVIAERCWRDIPLYFRFVVLDEFIIMPDHIHGIIRITEGGGRYKLDDIEGGGRYIEGGGRYIEGGGRYIEGGGRYICPLLPLYRTIPTLNRPLLPLYRTVPTSHPQIKKRNAQLIPVIVGNFKAAVSREINKKFPETCFRWQRSYHDQIIRNDGSFSRIRKYIKNNPKIHCNRLIKLRKIPV